MLQEKLLIQEPVCEFIGWKWVQWVPLLYNGRYEGQTRGVSEIPFDQYKLTNKRWVHSDYTVYLEK